MDELPDLSAEQFARFAALVRERASINLKENKITLLSNRLRRRLRALDLTDFDEYYDQLTARGAGEEMQRFIEVITTNESYFWRTEANFLLLKERILPELLATFSERRLAFWSAGCSTGEEPYNLAIELNESMKSLGYFMYEVLATDISERVVEFARLGRYADRKIERIPPAILRRYFREVPGHPGQMEVRQDLKEVIQFKVANLFGGRQPAQHCIFCRNVMIYFDRETQEELVRRFYETLHPGGFLIIGHSESLHGMNTKFEPCYFEEGTAYRRPVS